MSDTVLLTLLFFGHYLGDYTPLATTNMHVAKATGYPLWPIARHAGVHAILVLVILLVASVSVELALQLAAFEIVTHFIIDVAKGRITAQYARLQDNTGYPHWMLFGLDQWLHAVVLIWIFSWVHGV